MSVALNNIIRKLRLLDQAAANYVLEQYELGNIPDYNICDDPYAITYLFSWAEQPQPEGYWSDLYHRYAELPDQIMTPKGNIL